VDLPDLTTERLWLRPLRADDAADLHAAFADPACMRFWGEAPAADEHETRARVARAAAGEAQWAVGRQGERGALGYVGFVNGLEPDGHAGFGYLLRRSAWGQGYAAEAGRAALGHGFDVVGIARAELWIRRDNAPSIRVAEKLGARRRGDAFLHGHPQAIHGITAEEWRGEPEPPPVHYGVEPILGVTDVGAALAWWSEVLGFRTSFRYGEPPTHAAVLPGRGWTGGARVHLQERPAERTGGSSIYLVSGAVDAMAAQAVAAGATVVTPLGDRPWGSREIEVADPDGNRIRIGSG
jgi:RimJ/RimL family protein N-acetyltransferase/uncharacterized glyoxalase superfamily protein PhnB